MPSYKATRTMLFGKQLTAMALFHVVLHTDFPDFLIINIHAKKKANGSQRFVLSCCFSVVSLPSLSGLLRDNSFKTPEMSHINFYHKTSEWERLLFSSP